MINASRMKRKQLTAPRVNIIKLRGPREEERKNIPVAVAFCVRVPRSPSAPLDVNIRSFRRKITRRDINQRDQRCVSTPGPPGPLRSRVLCSTKARHLRRRQDKSRKVVRARARARLISEISVYRASSMTQSPPKRAEYIGGAPSGVPN